MKKQVFLVAALLLPYRPAAAKQDAKAQQLLQQMQTAYTNAKTMTATTTTKEYVEKNGTRQLNRTVKEKFEALRPASFRLEQVSVKPKQALHQQESISDGASVWNYDLQNKQYVKTSVNSPLTAIAAATGAPGDFFLHPERLGDMTKFSQSITMHYAGVENIAGVKCDKVEIHLPSPAEGIPASMQTYYIGPNHLLRRLTGQQQFKDQLYLTVIDVQTTVLDRKIPADYFIFMPPPGATEKKLPNSP